MFSYNSIEIDVYLFIVDSSFGQVIETNNPTWS